MDVLGVNAVGRTQKSAVDPGVDDRKRREDIDVSGAFMSGVDALRITPFCGVGGGYEPRVIVKPGV